MKYTVLFLASASLLLAACGNDKPTTTEVKAAEEQVAKDQAAMDSMEKVIQQQIEAVSDDSLMKVQH
jgi:outer membrane biogenesis lipoprotein LolB